MEIDEIDDDVIKLLTKLREAEGNYPVEMMSLRRQGYVKQIAALGIGAGAGAALNAAAKGAGGSSIPPIVSTILETALIVAIVAEAGFVAIINRDRVTELFRTISSQSTTEQVSPPPDVAAPLIEPSVVVMTAEPTELVTETSTGVGTPAPAMLFMTEADNPEDGDGPQANSTPDPNNDNDNSDNNGNHYGQTPIPERTKESGGGSDRRNDSRPTRR